MIVGAAVLPVGLFWYAFTSSPKINPWPQIVAGVPIGAGIQIITLQSLAYVLDIYSVDANSAVSGTVIIRSLLGGLFPLVAIPMYSNLGVSIFPSVLTFVSLCSPLSPKITGSVGFLHRRRHRSDVFHGSCHTLRVWSKHSILEQV